MSKAKKKKKYCHDIDLNPQPYDYKSDALTKWAICTDGQHDETSKS